MVDASLVRRGRCHRLGDDVSLDDGIIPQRFAAEQVIDAERLIPHLFENVAPGLAQRLAPGDIVIAGHNFAGGKPRLQGFIAMTALDLSILCVSMPYKMHRRAIARAIPVATGPFDATAIAAEGEEIEVDFGAGTARNLTRGGIARIPPMAPLLLDIVAGGGMDAALRDWLAVHPEQGTAAQASIHAGGK